MVAETGAQKSLKEHGKAQSELKLTIEKFVGISERYSLCFDELQPSILVLCEIMTDSSIMWHQTKGDNAPAQDRGKAPAIVWSNAKDEDTRERPPRQPIEDCTTKEHPDRFGEEERQSF